MELYPDSPKLGQKSPTGQILRWPETDVLGRPYTRSECTTQGLNDGYFMVVPPNGYAGVVEVIVPKIKPAKSKKVEADDSDE